jgi:Mn2+/Fe2+ NRAMP family transporter
VIGTAIALQLLLRIPLIAGALIAGLMPSFCFF